MFVKCRCITHTVVHASNTYTQVAGFYPLEYTHICAALRVTCVYSKRGSRVLCKHVTRYM